MVNYSAFHWSEKAKKYAEEAKKIGKAIVFKGSVNTVADLPTDAEIGDMYDVLDSGTNYAWTGDRWDSLGAAFDLSEYLKKTSSEEQFIQAPITIMDSMSVTDGAGGSFNVSLPNGVATIATNNGLDVLTETTFEDGVKVRGVGHALAFEGMAGTTTSGILLKDTYGGNQSKIGHYATGDRYGLRFYTETALGYSGYFDLYTTTSNITIADFSTGIESVLVPTPDETDSSKRAANTEWVHTLFHGGELDVENLVDLSSNQDIDGAKTFKKNLTTYGGLDIVNGAVTKGTNPTSAQYWGLFRANDKTRDSAWKNTRLGIAELSLSADGTTQMIFGTYKNEAGSSSNAVIAVGYTLSGGPYANAPTPPAGSNSTNIATTAWVKANAPAPTITYLD